MKHDETTDHNNIHTISYYHLTAPGQHLKHHLLSGTHSTPSSLQIVKPSIPYQILWKSWDWKASMLRQVQRLDEPFTLVEMGEISMPLQAARIF
jgi:hypothetical protein